MKIAPTPYFSYRLHSLPKGCQYCVKGQKLVLFLTGLCPRHCFYCPLSEHKYQQDVTFANERPVKSFKDIKTEAKLMKAKGAGITGGDPLAKLPRTLYYLKQLKKTFGKKFHIHLYTSLNLVNLSALKKLHHAGLDEIRFHLDLDHHLLWPKLSLAREFSWDIGVEVPLLLNKEKQLRQMISFIQDKVHFLNLNELELADTPVSHLRKLGFQQKNSLSYAVKGSESLGLSLLNYILKKDYHLPTHLCTVRLKDAVQMTQRVKRQARYSRQPFDRIDHQGMLLRGALYLPETVPGFAYHQKLTFLNSLPFLNRLKKIRSKISRELKLNARQLYLDKNKARLLLSPSSLKKYKAYFKSLNLKPALVKEYPTYDQLEVELEFI